MVARFRQRELLEQVTGDLNKLRGRGQHDSAVNVSYGDSPLRTANQLLEEAEPGGGRLMCGRRGVSISRRFGGCRRCIIRWWSLRATTSRWPESGRERPTGCVRGVGQAPIGMFWPLNGYAGPLRWDELL